MYTVYQCDTEKSLYKAAIYRLAQQYRILLQCICVICDCVLILKGLISYCMYTDYSWWHSFAVHICYKLVVDSQQSYDSNKKDFYGFL